MIKLYTVCLLVLLGSFFGNDVCAQKQLNASTTTSSTQTSNKYEENKNIETNGKSNSETNDKNKGNHDGNTTDNTIDVNVSLWWSTIQIEGAEGPIICIFWCHLLINTDIPSI
jgi:hypothetical protein